MSNLSIEQVNKVNYKNIPQETIDYYINDFLTNENASYDDNFIIQILRGLCYKLALPYRKDITVETLSQEELEKKSKIKDSIGLFTSDKIYLSIESILRIRDKDIEPIDTIMHEIRHLRQHYLIDKNEISWKVYQLIIDNIIVHEMDEQYYHDNYWYLYEEVDARISSSLATYRYLKKVSPEFAINILYESIKYIIMSEKELSVTKRKVGNKELSKEEILDRIIYRKPEYLSIYPILNFYYDEQGRKYTIKEILLRNRRTPSSDEDILNSVFILDKSILKHRDGTYRNLKKDLSSLYDIDLIEMCSNDSELNKTREQLISYLSQKLASKSSTDQLADLYEFFQKKFEITLKFFKDEAEKLRLAEIKLYLMLNSLENPFLNYKIKNEKMKRK